MNTMNMVEILLVEDSAEDIEVTLRAFKKQNLANRLHVVEDGEQALDYIFATGQYNVLSAPQGFDLMQIYYSLNSDSYI